MLERKDGMMRSGVVKFINVLSGGGLKKDSYKKSLCNLLTRLTRS